MASLGDRNVAQFFVDRPVFTKILEGKLVILPS